MTTKNEELKLIKSFDSQLRRVLTSMRMVDQAGLIKDVENQVPFNDLLHLLEDTIHDACIDFYKTDEEREEERVREREDDEERAIENYSLDIERSIMNSQMI